MKNEMSLEGAVLKVNGELLLLIPLTDGDSGTVRCSRSISETEMKSLRIVIPRWLAGMLDIEEGDSVCVHTDGKLHVNTPNPGLVH